MLATPGYVYSSFGINLYITDGNGNTRADQPTVTDMLCGAGSANSSAANIYNDYRGTFTTSFVLRQNDIIRVNAVSNGVFNQSGGQPENTYYFQGGDFNDGSYMTLTAIAITGV
jgi:hypothetical protein